MKQESRTWYDRMENFLVTLVFTKSKEDSNLYFKVEDGRPMILMLYVNDLFLTGGEELIIDARRRLLRDEIPRNDALLFRDGGVAE